MITLSFISFGAASMFFGSVLLALPIAAHLLNRRARRRVIFPTVMLLSAASASQSQLFKLRRLILLALRCLAVLLLILAFTKPTWRQRAGAASTASRGAAAVLIVDLSASTLQRADGITAMQALRAAAGRSLDQLEPGADVANIVFASARPRAAFPSLTGNLDALRQALELMTPTAERADLPAALALAGKLLGGHNGTRHLIVLTDLQATNWAEVEARLSADRPVPDNTRLSIVRPPAPAPGNLGLATPAADPAAPVADQQANLAVTLTNYGPQQQTCTVDLTIDGRRVDAQSVSVEPWRERELVFGFKFETPGNHEVAFAIPSDALEVDNKAYLATRVVRRLEVVVIGDDDPDERGTSSYFTIRALAPRDTEGDRHDVRHLSSAEVAGSTLTGAAAVFVSYCGELPPAALAALHRYLLDGGGVVFFCGDGPVDRNLQALDALAEGGLLPWKLGARRDLGARGKLLSLGDGDWRSSLLSTFDLRSREALRRIRFSRVWSVGEVSPDARLLLKYADGSGAIGSRHIGAGKLVVANFSPAWGHSDLAKHGSFVALLHSLALDLQPRGAVRSPPTVGHTLTFTSATGFDPQGPAVGVVGPDDKPIEDVALSSVGDKLTVTVPQPALPGFYRVVQAGQALGGAGVNVDKRESDLRRVEAEVLESQLHAQGVDAGVLVADDRQDVLDTRGRPLWGTMFAAALLVLGIELALLGYWRR